MWTCPWCGHRFVSANSWHSCTTVTLDEAYARSTPGARAAFERLVELVQRCGPVEVIAQKTRIGLRALVCEGYHDLGQQESLRRSGTPASG